MFWKCRLFQSQSNAAFFPKRNYWVLRIFYNGRLFFYIFKRIKCVIWNTLDILFYEAIPDHDKVRLLPIPQAEYLR